VLDIHYSPLKSEQDDVRWEKVDNVRLMLASGTYHVCLAEVAAKVIDQMLESGTHHWKNGRSSRTTNSNSHVGVAYDCEGSQNKYRKADGPEARAANRHET
jgi:hypothetical protein